jgi:hypothetical protein
VPFEATIRRPPFLGVAQSSRIGLGMLVSLLTVAGRCCVLRPEWCQQRCQTISATLLSLSTLSHRVSRQVWRPYPEHSSRRRDCHYAVTRVKASTPPRHSHSIQDAAHELRRRHLPQCRVHNTCQASCSRCGTVSARNHSETSTGGTSPLPHPPVSCSMPLGPSLSLTEEASRVFLASYFLL